MLSAARCLVTKTCQQRKLSLSAVCKGTRTSNIAEYCVVDHAYDAVVVGAGWLFDYSFSFHNTNSKSWSYFNE